MQLQCSKGTNIPLPYGGPPYYRMQCMHHWHGYICTGNLDRIGLLVGKPLSFSHDVCPGSPYFLILCEVVLISEEKAPCTCLHMLRSIYLLLPSASAGRISKDLTICRYRGSTWVPLESFLNYLLRGSGASPGLCRPATHSIGLRRLKMVHRSFWKLLLVFGRLFLVCFPKPKVARF